MWPFTQRSGGADPRQRQGVEELPGLTETEFYEKVRSGEETHFGGKGSCAAISELDRAREAHHIMRTGDYRAAIMDPEAIDCIVSRFSKELAVADDLMREKLENKRRFTRYDYANDRRFQQWKQDREDVHTRLQVHWIDMLIDRPATVLVYCLRVGVVAGFFYGCGRTAYLYRTMDKVYAKLNGVTVGKIGFHELTFAIGKGGITATAATLGVVVGNVISSLATIAMNGDVHVPERQWWHVVNCGAFAGLFAGAAFAGLHMSTFTRRAMVACTLGLGCLGSAVGGYYGYCVYRPFAATRTHRLYDTYWRPWQERRMKMEGPGNVRGRYL